MRLVVLYSQQDNKGVTQYNLYKGDESNGDQLDQRTVDRIVSMANKVLGEAYIGYQVQQGWLLKIMVKTGSMRSGQGKFNTRAFLGWAELFLLDE